MSSDRRNSSALYGSVGAMARELAEQLFGVVKGIEDPALLIQAYCVVGVTSFFIGEEVAAR